MGGKNVGNAQSAASGRKMYALVYDGEGNPLFDDYFDIHPAYRSLLTEKDWQYIKEQQEKQNGNHT